MISFPCTKCRSVKPLPPLRHYRHNLIQKHGESINGSVVIEYIVRSQEGEAYIHRKYECRAICVFAILRPSHHPLAINRESSA